MSFGVFINLMSFLENFHFLEKSVKKNILLSYIDFNIKKIVIWMNPAESKNPSVGKLYEGRLHPGESFTGADLGYLY